MVMKIPSFEKERFVVRKIPLFEGENVGYEKTPIGAGAPKNCNCVGSGSCTRKPGSATLAVSFMKKGSFT